jgi:hypothetical protein
VTKTINRLLAVLLGSTALVAACGGDDETPAASDASDITTTSAAAPAAVTRAGWRYDGPEDSRGYLTVKNPCDVITSERIAEIMGNGPYDPGRPSGINSSQTNGAGCLYVLPGERQTAMSVSIGVFTAGTNGALGGGNGHFKDHGEPLNPVEAEAEVEGATRAYLSSTQTARSLSAYFGRDFGFKIHITVGVGQGLDIATFESKMTPLRDLVLSTYRA